MSNITPSGMTDLSSLSLTDRFVILKLDANGKRIFSHIDWSELKTLYNFGIIEFETFNRNLDTITEKHIKKRNLPTLTENKSSNVTAVTYRASVDNGVTWSTAGGISTLNTWITNNPASGATEPWLLEITVTLSDDKDGRVWLTY